MRAPNAENSSFLNRFLRVAVVAGVENAVQVHIDRGDDLNARDSHGLTPLMLAASKNRSTICRMLLEAGADASLRAPAGETALSIALAAKAQDTFEVLTTYLSTNTSLVRGDELNDRKVPVVPVEPEFDLSGWETEATAAPPEEDPSVAIEAIALHSAISSHQPVDDSTEWDDVDAYLPLLAAPLARADDAETRTRLRLLFLRAIREGSVPSADVEQLAVNDDRSPNAELEAFLSRLVNDLGAEVDERFEYTTSIESFEVFVYPAESATEEEMVDEAIAALEDYLSRRSDPLRIYQREFQRQKRISAEDEIALARAMEKSLSAALDALAQWPKGIASTILAGEKVKGRTQALSWMSLTPAETEAEQQTNIKDESGQTKQVEIDVDDVTDIHVEGQSAIAAFTDALDRLASVKEIENSQRPETNAIRSALADLNLNRRFLQELSDAVGNDTSEAARELAHAMQAHQRAREQMVQANLKLAFHLAKKYLYSGEPLDDLAQEANIGLIKAVERYDWRRGFKFSTYATWWIRQQITRHIADNSRTIRVPVHMHEKLYRLERLTADLESSLGRHPSAEELGLVMEMPPDKVVALQRSILPTVSIHDLAIDEVVAAEAKDRFTVSDPEKITSNAELIKSVEKLLGTLKAKEAQIIRLRFGIGVDETLTLDEIGRRFEVTRERIRQIEAKVMKRLQSGAQTGPVLKSHFHEAGESVQPLTGAEYKNAITDSKWSLRHEQTLNVSPVSTDYEPRRRFTIDHILHHASQLGVSTSDERNEVSGRVWVFLDDVKGTKLRGLARRLNDMGFSYVPGQGYFK